MQPNYQQYLPLINGYTVLQQIGEGSIGKVYLGVDQQNRRVAIKQISSMINDGKSNRYLEKELDIIRFLIDSNKQKPLSRFIVEYYGIEQHNNNFYLISEICQFGDLYNHMQQFYNFYTYEIKLEFFVEIITGIEAIHNLNICHRDLKPENILIAQDPQTNNYYLKITDFGISSLKAQDMLSTVGTIVYMAPEIIYQQPYDLKVDVWSFGCLVHEMLTNQLYFPYTSDSQTAKLIKSHKEYKRGQTEYPNIEEVIALCLKPNPSDRPSSTQIKQMLINIQKDYSTQQFKQKNIFDDQNHMPIRQSIQSRVSQILSKQTRQAELLLKQISSQYNQKSSLENSQLKNSQIKNNSESYVFTTMYKQDMNNSNLISKGNQQIDQSQSGYYNPYSLDIKNQSSLFSSSQRVQEFSNNQSNKNQNNSRLHQSSIRESQSNTINRSQESKQNSYVKDSLQKHSRISYEEQNNLRNSSQEQINKGNYTPEDSQIKEEDNSTYGQEYNGQNDFTSNKMNKKKSTQSYSTQNQEISKPYIYGYKSNVSDKKNRKAQPYGFSKGQSKVTEISSLNPMNILFIFLFTLVITISFLFGKI